MILSRKTPKKGIARTGRKGCSGVETDKKVLDTGSTQDTIVSDVKLGPGIDDVTGQGSGGRSVSRNVEVGRCLERRRILNIVRAARGRRTCVGETRVSRLDKLVCCGAAKLGGVCGCRRVETLQRIR